GTVDIDPAQRGDPALVATPIAWANFAIEPFAIAAPVALEHHQFGCACGRRHRQRRRKREQADNSKTHHCHTPPAYCQPERNARRLSNDRNSTMTRCNMSPSRAAIA